MASFIITKKKINSLAKNTHHKVSLILKPLGLYKYLKKSDLIINAGGTTLLEACVLKKKSITVSVWPTQDKLTKNILNTKNYIIYNNNKKNIQKKIDEKIRSIFFKKNFLNIQKI